MSLRRLLFALTAVLSPLGVVAVVQASELPQVQDLRIEAKQAEQKRVPILVMFGADHCTYCKRLEADFLKPMHDGGFYNDKVLIRHVLVGDGSLIDFDGQKVTGSELAERYGITVTPTVVFLDPKGRQLTHKMVGLTTPEYYGSYLDQAIETSLDRMRRTTPLVVKISSK
jgi:thioredoxin-related protein